MEFLQFLLLYEVYEILSENNLNSNLSDLESTIEAHSFGTSIPLTSGVEYTCPCDGYVSTRYNNSSYIPTVYVNGIALLNAGILFVRKGMVLKYVGNNNYANASFLPII